MGLSTELHPTQNCSPLQRVCDELPAGGSPEVSQKQFDLLSTYVRFLAVPARRHTDDPEVQAGRQLFFAAACSSCHRPQLKTPDTTPYPLHAGQSLWPYSDLLLHDMGEGLADHRPDGLASGREWRTPPLWGIGLSQVVSGSHFFLHDGRARSLEEAILWHGGETEKSRLFYEQLSAGERERLLAFLNSL